MRHIRQNIGCVLMVLVALVTMINPARAQENRYLGRGNKAYKQKDYKTAEKQYNNALEKNTESYSANFNLGDALYQQKKYKESAGYFQRANELSKNKEQRELSYYNLGNSYLKQEEIEESITAYKNALKLNPDNIYAKYNLSYAIEKRKQKQKQQQSKNQPQPQPKNQEDQKKQQQKDKQQEKQQVQNIPDKDKTKISDAEAEQIMDALKNNEEKIRQRIYDNRRRPIRRRAEKPW